MAKTIVVLVNCESAAWMEGGRGLLEGVIVGAPKIFPPLNADEKLALAKKVLGENLRKPKTHDFSVIIGTMTSPPSNSSMLRSTLSNKT